MKKETWKMMIQIAISILTAIATSLGVTSCMLAANQLHVIIFEMNPIKRQTAPPIYIYRRSGFYFTADSHTLPASCHTASGSTWQNSWNC